MSLRPPLAFNTRPRRLSTPTDAFQLPKLTDHITSRRDDSCAWLREWTGAGCCLGGVIATFVAAVGLRNEGGEGDPVRAACAWYRRVASATQDKGRGVDGPASFQVAFFDALHAASRDSQRA